MIASEKVAATAPYAITAGDQTICYVSNKAAADKVLSDLVDNYAAEGSDIKAVSNEDISAEQADDAKVDTNGIKNVKEAFALVDEEIQNNDDVKIVVAGTRTDLEKFRPDTVNEKDDTMFAGEAVVKDEGSYGEKEVTKMIKTLNGEVAGTTVIESNVVKEGTPEVVVKGTLGLPDGEDWETYEGDPVFNDADDLIATCKKYIGAPYKYGGHSLTNGIDCVQYVRQMFAKYGISIPNKHSQIQKVGKGVSLSEAQPGDIVCWTHHVGIYIGNGKVINATRKKGVTISSVHMKKKLVTVRRVPRN
jgi:cell wall-associated NlpC family hydrolase